MKIFFLSIILVAITSLVHAQQKPSERPFSLELKKISEKQAERKKLIGGQPASAPAVPQQPPAANDKPSDRPVKIPVRPPKRN